MPGTPRPAILAYQFPQWHVDPRNEAWHGPGWTEWELVRANVPRFAGHRPLRPALGYLDESNPGDMAREIDLAADHGIDGFLFDIYWFEDGPFLDRAITEGFLKAPNRDRMKFCCMWANHTWRNWHPCKATQKPWSDAMLVEGHVTRAAFDRLTEVIAEWCARPEYFRVQGKPYFSIYETMSLVKGMGEDGATAALEHLRERVQRRAGTDLHLNCVIGRLGATGDAAQRLVKKLGFESITPYNAFDHISWNDLAFPVGSYPQVQAANAKHWAERDAETGLAYIPGVTSGWDCSGRACVTDKWVRRDYPWTPVVRPTREQWRAALEELRRWFDANPTALPVATLNAWNEWTEGAILLPDEDWGLMLLEEVKAIFGRS